MNSRPMGYTKWRHKGNGKVVTFLTVAEGVGPDGGQEFAYFMAPTKNGNLKARVMRMEIWHEAMELIEDTPSDSPRAE